MLRQKSFRRLKEGQPASARKERLHRAYEETAADTSYHAEMDEIDRAFDAAVGDGLEPVDARELTSATLK